MFIRLNLPLLFLLLLGASLPGVAAEPALEAETLWDVNRLLSTPTASTFEQGEAQEREHCTIRPVWYDGEPYRGKPTRVFAYLGLPKNVEQGKKFPGIVLVHGGGGKAFDKWAEHWASRGYVSLAMDLAGCGPDGQRHENAGPGQSDTEKFGDFDRNDPTSIRDIWTYHAIADILLAHAHLAAREEVDSKRIAVTGISWGGYLTCILAGVDPNLAAAVPVYGCGFLHENSAWLGLFAKMTPQKREDWIALFDPGSYLGRVKCPMLFVNGTNDFAYPLDSYRKSYRQAQKGKRDLAMALEIERPHSHIWTFPEVDAFIDEYCRPEKPLPPLCRLSDVETLEQTKVVAKILDSAGNTPGVKTVELCYTEDSGPWKDRRWKTVPGKIDHRTLSATLPGEKVTAFFLQVTDEFGRKTSTP